MALQHTLRSIVLGMTLAGASAGVAAVPPASGHAGQSASLQSQLKDVEAKLAEARTRNGALQSQVAQLEQQNAARQKQMQARDAEIAALQQKLQAAGVPASAASTQR